MLISYCRLGAILLLSVRIRRLLILTFLPIAAAIGGGPMLDNQIDYQQRKQQELIHKNIFSKIDIRSIQ